MSGILGAYQLEFIIKKDPTFVSKDLFSAHTVCAQCIRFYLIILFKALLDSQKNIGHETIKNIHAKLASFLIYHFVVSKINKNYFCS